MQKFEAINNNLTPVTVGAFGVLTWFFSAMQCNQEYCFTTDNPIAQVIFAGAAAALTVAAVTSSPIANKLTEAKTFLQGKFKTETADKTKTATTIKQLEPSEVTKNVAASPTLFSPTSSTRAQSPTSEAQSAGTTPKSDSNSPSPKAL